jgi:hypothetical protein
MNDDLANLDKAILAILSRVRGARAETLHKYPQLKSAGSLEALRKRLDRRAESGILATSKLPRGSQIYRLSQKGVRLVGAPAAWAASPSPAVAGDMLSASAFGVSDEFIFLTRVELEALLRELSGENEATKTMGRFVLRRVGALSASEAKAIETHLHFWLSELRPAEELVSRIKTVAENLGRTEVFRDLIAARAFGFTVVVATESAKTHLSQKSFPAETKIETLAELQDIVSL